VDLGRLSGSPVPELGAEAYPRLPKCEAELLRRPANSHYLGPMARKDISMTEDEVQEFLSSGAKVLQVASIGKDGMPHLAPMWFTMDDGRVVFRSFTKSQKIVNLARDPRITVLVETGDTYATLQGVMIKGRAELIADPSYVLEIYGRLAARYPFAGDTPVPLEADALEQAFGPFAPKNTAVIVEPTQITSWDHTKLDGTY
jgi:PPOX class probable F420-dependent enzyme